MQPVWEQQRRVEPVKVGSTEFYVELADGGDPERNVGWEDFMSFDGVRETVEAVAGELAKAWEHVKPAEASVEFGLSLTAKSGKLTGLLIGVNGGASVKVTLTWKFDR